jgi:hypothetical protein
MQIATLIYGTGSVGPFASRAFVPAFITALMLRFAPEYVSWISDDMVRVAADAPGWFISDASLIIFGLLAALEIAATKSQDIRAAYQEIDKYIKPLVAIITYMGVVTTQDTGFFERATQQAGFADSLPALMIGVGVFWLGTLRGGLLGFFIDADEDDDIGAQGLFSWAEDLWAFCGPILLLIFPIVMLLLLGFITGLLVLIQKRAQAKEELSKTPCTNCGEKIYNAAINCPACQTPTASPGDVNFLGRSLDVPTPDLQAHPYKLVEKKRCPVCATRFEKRAVHQQCHACGHHLFKDPDFTHAYLARSDARLPIVLLLSALFSLIPVLGLIPGIIYYRITLIAPIRKYIPRSRAIFLRWGIRIIFFLLIMFQWFPLAGGLVVPIMALVNYTVYRSAFKTMLDNDE